MNDAALSNSPTPARLFEVSDERLAADLKKSPGSTPANYPVGELLDRHWEAVFSYARLCTDGVRPAGMLTTAAFTRLFGESLRQTGPTAAWRPQLLVAVRRIAAEWLTDRRSEHLHPELRPGPDGEERAAARLLPPESRRLLARAFQRLSEPARCLLWHTEAEAEQLHVPAALLGLDEDDAAVELRRARERLREGCLEVHRELAPAEECRRYNRMLDVSLRRGGADLDPDLRRHMARCDHCRHAADQLNKFNGRLARPLAEAVLGWGAHSYLETRQGRATAIVEVTEAPEAAATARTGHFPLPAEAPRPPSFPPRPTPRGSAHTDSRPPTHKAPRRASRRRNVALAVLTLSALIVVPLVAWAGLGSGGDSVAEPSSGPDKAPGANPSWIGSGDQPITTGGRLRNSGNGLCIGIVGDKPVKGAETQLTSCTSKSVQQWSYEEDGQLRNVADPDLCLDSHLGYSVQLAPCTGDSQPDTKNVRYDFTLQGALVPRWNQDLALTPASPEEEAALVLKVREDEPAQRWTLDTTSPSLQLEVVNWGADSESRAPAADPAPTPSKSPSTSTTPKPSVTPSTPKATPSSASPTYGSCYYPYNYYCSGDGQHGGSDYGYGDGYGYGYGDGYGNDGYGGGHR
ncbi:RICIN domain-containing protein [Streptomyces sp. NBC_00564]|uniref:RICIN domain-containing protein n=1 Tax=Streptomyces sp. NBC_00564 TaxID=2903663 RepID=UPI00352DC801|nr:RICIN domain-containing protein [Streptomyces sp. NBC_00564]